MSKVVRNPPLTARGRRCGVDSDAALGGLPVAARTMSATPPVTFALYRPRALRFDVLPFVVLYAIGSATYLLASPPMAHNANILVPAVVACHFLTFLVCHWSLPMRCAMQLTRVRRVAEATLVRVNTAGRSEMCMLQNREAWGCPGVEETRFEHRKRTYIWRPAAEGAGTAFGSRATIDEATGFAELIMPIDLPISHYLSGGRGLRGEALHKAVHDFGANHFAIPAHSFGALLLEHALAPFFVFQVFCVVLWSLDDYWYGPLLLALPRPAAPSPCLPRGGAPPDLRAAKDEPPDLRAAKDEKQWST